VPTFGEDEAYWKKNTYWDEESQATYAYDETAQKFFSFDDARSVAAKAKYLKSKKLGGFMYWFVGGDSKSNELLGAMYDGLGPHAPTPAPLPTPAPAPTPGPAPAGKHGDHIVVTGDNCYNIAVKECGEDTPCDSTSCPAICDAKTICGHLQIGQDVKYDCGMKGQFCPSPTTPTPAPLPTPAPAPTPKPAPGTKHGDHYVTTGDNCYNIGAKECGEDTPCDSASCPAICDAKAICGHLQIGQDVKYDCGMKGQFC
jgi:hypothetical protein